MEIGDFMRIVNENFKNIDESLIDLSKGYLISSIAIREEAKPIDNITKFAWDDDDYEEVQMYIVNHEPEEHSETVQDDIDAMLIDHEYRLTLLELGV